MMVKITLEIEGMACGMCEAHVNDAIRRAFPVKKVSASHSKGRAEILSETEIPESELRQALDGTGYRLTGYRAEPYVKKGLFGR